ncbi:MULTISPECIES: pheA operon leader peptide PheL [Enterobacteriaceae]|nr:MULTISPECIES: pheA operon leader peptide PheL [Enterobacteriaceae]MCR4458406.1 pheA operon leader peptide PheL [Pseudescherichia sp. L3]MDU5455227.1 pheA operon leader peptide PheL [Pseudescherichia vulneris]WAH54528.1 pheA operon leader peptide PheL [Pseudescherichia vulneris]WPO97366.1 pheA operon leader peptide PheL [Buttiauxella sp. HR94]
MKQTPFFFARFFTFP